MKKRGRFHVLRIEHVSEEQQGLIYYICRCYPNLPQGKKRILDELYASVGGSHSAALRAVMETDESFVKICREHFIASETTLNRLRTQFFMEFPLEKMLK